MCFPNSYKNGLWETSVELLGLIQFQLSGNDEGNGYSSCSFYKCKQNYRSRIYSHVWAFTLNSSSSKTGFLIFGRGEKKETSELKNSNFCLASKGWNQGILPAMWPVCNCGELAKRGKAG
jgi:hypothetical protein